MSETVNLLTHSGCWATINEPTAAKAASRMNQIIDGLATKSILEVSRVVVNSSYTLITFDNGNTLHVRTNNA